MIPFDAAHKAVHYPPDRRFRFWIRPSFVAGAVALIHRVRSEAPHTKKRMRSPMKKLGNRSALRLSNHYRMGG
jgi:hypothetical protein